jgi:capsular exopolysaccharide synthesis family protein
MGRVFDALQHSIGNHAESPIPNFAVSAEIQESAASEQPSLNDVGRLTVVSVPEQHLVALDAQRSLGAEKMHILASKLRHLQERNHMKSLLITSTVNDEGKTVLSTNLAVSLARMKQRVLLIDGDVHQASASTLLGASGTQGLTEWWRSQRPIQTYLTRVNELPLWFLPAGGSIDQPIEMLQAGRLSSMFTDVSRWFEWIVIDSPPSAPLADSVAWAKLADGVLLVARDGRTPKRLLKRVLSSLNNSKLLGIVLNDCPDPDRDYYTHYYNVVRER